LTAIRLGIVALTLATAAIHIVLAIPLAMIGFYLNGAGYVALVTALCLPSLAPYRRPLRWLLMEYTALTIMLRALIGRPYTTIGYVDKRSSSRSSYCSGSTVGARSADPPARRRRRLG
jgi:hypothetical protein